MLGNIIQHHVASLFHGVQVKGAHLFRITRNSDLYIDEEEAENLLNAIEAELRKRESRRGRALRRYRQTARACRGTPARNLQSRGGRLYRVDGPLNFVRLMPLALQIDRPELRYKRFTPYTVVSLEAESDIFFHIRKGDILLHHPYDNFQTVVDFLAQAAEDPHVLAIKKTLYRTSARLANRSIPHRCRAQWQAGHRCDRTEGPLRRGRQYQLGAHDARKPAWMSSTASWA